MVERGENTNAFHELVTLILEWALLPFAVGIGVAAWMIGQKLMTSTGAGVILSIAPFYGVWFGYSSYKQNTYGNEARPGSTTSLTRVDTLELSDPR